MRRLDPRTLYARVGDRVIDKFNALVDALRSSELFAGPGILLTPRIGGGVTISARRAVTGFAHPWEAFVSSNQAEFNLGLVNGIEPTIGGVPMSGKDGGPRPKLTLSTELFDSTGRSWLSLRLTRQTDASKVSKIAKLELIQTDIYLGQDGGTPEVSEGVALEPIVMLKRAAKDRAGLGVVHQIRFFHVTNWRVRLDNPGGPRHFFG